MSRGSTFLRASTAASSTFVCVANTTFGAKPLRHPSGERAGETVDVHARVQPPPTAEAGRPLPPLHAPDVDQPAGDEQRLRTVRLVHHMGLQAVELVAEPGRRGRDVSQPSPVAAAASTQWSTGRDAGRDAARLHAASGRLTVPASASRRPDHRRTSPRRTTEHGSTHMDARVEDRLVAPPQSFEQPASARRGSERRRALRPATAAARARPVHRDGRAHGRRAGTARRCRCTGGRMTGATGATACGGRWRARVGSGTVDCRPRRRTGGAIARPSRVRRRRRDGRQDQLPTTRRSPVAPPRPHSVRCRIPTTGRG